MEDFIVLLKGHGEYILLGIGVIIVLFVLKILLNRPTREERERQARIDRLKKEHANRYRDLRPLR
jgi:type II secretory pathway component PulM